MKKSSLHLNIAIAGIILIIIGLVFLPQSWNLIRNAKPKAYGQGYIPLFAALGLFLCGIILFREAFQKGKERARAFQWKKLFRGIGLPIVSLIFYSAFMELLGFAIATFLLLVILLRILKVYSWTLTLTISSITAISFHYIFGVWLFLPLPKGKLISYIFFS